MPILYPAPKRLPSFVERDVVLGGIWAFIAPKWPDYPLNAKQEPIRNLKANLPAAIINPANLPWTDGRVNQRVSASLNKTLSGVSRDSAGVALANCQVLIYNTGNRGFVAETTSDSSGNWSVSMLVGGPFFTVEYKAGAPDVAGTSVNTLVPV